MLRGVTDLNMNFLGNWDFLPQVSRHVFRPTGVCATDGAFASPHISPLRTFTEKGLYMLATILKSPVATQATISIIETFTKIRELSRSVKELSTIQDKTQQKALMQRSGELIAEIFDEDLQTSDTETSIELNFAVLKFKHTIKKKNK